MNSSGRRNGIVKVNIISIPQIRRNEFLVHLANPLAPEVAPFPTLVAITVHHACTAKRLYILSRKKKKRTV